MERDPDTDVLGGLNDRLLLAYEDDNFLLSSTTESEEVRRCLMLLRINGEREALGATGKVGLFVLGGVNFIEALVAEVAFLGGVLE